MRATLTSKGQVTIPKAIRDLVHLADGDAVEFRVRADGIVELHPLNVDILAWFGRIRPDVHVAIDEMDPGKVP